MCCANKLHSSSCFNSSKTRRRSAVRYAGRVSHLLRGLPLFGIAGFVLASATLFGQSKEELRRKYGEPVSETFMVRPGVTVTATYTKSGRIAELLISPVAPGYVKSQGLRKPMNKDFVQAVIDELLPSSMRGKFVIAGFDNMQCLPTNDCWGSSEEYAKASIYYNAGRDGTVSYAVVTLKK